MLKVIVLWSVQSLPAKVKMNEDTNNICRFQFHYNVIVGDVIEK